MIKDRDFTLSNIQGAQFAANFTVTTALGSISIPCAGGGSFDTGDGQIQQPYRHCSRV